MYLQIKKKWFDMIASGEKKEECFRKSNGNRNRKLFFGMGIPQRHR